MEDGENLAVTTDPSTNDIIFAPQDLVRLMAIESNMMFISVDYRLGPEHPWPAQLEDCLAAVQWVRKVHAGTTRVFLVGTSAGAQLALSVAASLSETNRRVAGVVALAPFTIRREDAVKYIGEEPISHLENEDAPILTMNVLDMLLGTLGISCGMR